MNPSTPTTDYNPAEARIPEQVPTFGITNRGYIASPLVLGHANYLADGCIPNNQDDPSPKGVVPTTWEDAAAGLNHVKILAVAIEDYVSPIAQGLDQLLDQMADNPQNDATSEDVIETHKEFAQTWDEFLTKFRDAIEVADRLAANARYLAADEGWSSFFGTTGYHSLYPIPAVTLEPLDPFERHALEQRARVGVEARYVNNDPMAGLRDFLSKLQESEGGTVVVDEHPEIGSKAADIFGLSETDLGDAPGAGYPTEPGAPQTPE